MEEVNQCGLTGLTIVVIGSDSQTKGTHTFQDRENEMRVEGGGGLMWTEWVDNSDIYGVLQSRVLQQVCNK